MGIQEPSKHRMYDVFGSGWYSGYTFEVINNAGKT
jgi:hypothetical protein